MLATLTPAEYAQFRGVLGNASGFQSAQYRAVEFMLGNKNAAMLRCSSPIPPPTRCARALEAPSLYDEFLRLLARAGYAIPESVLERDVTQAWTFMPELVPVFAGIYADPEAHWAAYETCEELVDLEDNFQLWRFRHLKTVERIIGFKTGTGGSSGCRSCSRRSSSRSSPSCSPFAPRSRGDGCPYRAFAPRTCSPPRRRRCRRRDHRRDRHRCFRRSSITTCTCT